MGVARHVSLAQIRNLPGETEQAFRTIVEWWAQQVDDINDRIDRLTGVEGNIPKFDSDGGLEDSEKTPPDGTIVGTTDEQTLTQKTLTSPTMTGGTITSATIASPTITDATITDPDFTSADGSFEFVSDAANTDISMVFGGTTNDGQFLWMEDEDYFQFSDDIAITGGENIVLSATTGTKIGTAPTQKLGFWNATPVDQPATVSDAATQVLTGTDTVDITKVTNDLTSCKNAINAIIDRLQEAGIVA